MNRNAMLEGSFDERGLEYLSRRDLGRGKPDKAFLFPELGTAM
jgi:hypothetical protein